MQSVRSVRSWAGLGGATAAVVLAAACGSSSSSSSSSSSNGPQGDDGGDVSSPCDTTQDPANEPCLVSGAYGVFVSPSGSDTTGDGSQAMPYATVGKGLDAAKAAGKQVFVCAGTYDEHVVIDAARDGVGVHGGFSCADWSYAKTNVVRVAPHDPGPALRVDALSTGTAVSDLELDAVDAQTPGDSSIAVLVNASHGVVFRRVTMKSGNGADGAAGADGASMSNYDVNLMPSDPKIAGNNATTFTGATAQTCTGLCTNANGLTSMGGAGANYGSRQPGGNGGPAIPENPPGQTPRHDGAGGAPGFGTQFGIAGDGDPGASAADGQGGAAAQSYGTLSSVGWTPSNGQPGVAGGPGQGGGGGGGAYDNGNGVGGGGGGCGGCGGSAGQGGQGGGGSFALVSVASDVLLDTCTLAAGNGGAGGKGGAGQVGQQGGVGGTSTNPDSGKGGPGGAGGAGGGGGGGTGGVSIAVAYTASAPSVAHGTSATVGNPGHGGAGGTGTTATNAGAPGLDGVALASKGF
jgi:hypothetical protein